MKRTVAIVMLVCIVITLLMRSCVDNHIVTSLQSELDFANSLNDSMSNTLQKERLKNGELLVQVNSLEFHSKDLEKRLRNKNIKDLDSKTEFKTVTRVDTLVVQLHDTVYVASNDTIRAKKFAYNDKWLSVGGLIRNDELSLDSIKLYNEFDVQLGKAKDGFLKRKNVVTVQSKNPHTDINSVRSYTFPDDKKWYQKGYIPFAIGVGLTFLILN